MYIEDIYNYYIPPIVLCSNVYYRVSSYFTFVFYLFTKNRWCFSVNADKIYFRIKILVFFWYTYLHISILCWFRYVVFIFITIGIPIYRYSKALLSIDKNYFCVWIFRFIGEIDLVGLSDYILVQYSNIK